MGGNSVQGLVCVVSCDASNNVFSLSLLNKTYMKIVCLIQKIVNMIKCDASADKYCFWIVAFHELMISIGACMAPAAG